MREGRLVVMSRKRMSHVRRQLRSKWLQFLRQRGAFLLIPGALLVGMGAALTWVMDGYLLGLAHGLLVAAFALMTWTVLLLATGTTFQLSGAWGEDATRDELRIAKRKGLIFGSIDNVELRDGDVDHLVVTATGVVAIDSKWHSHGISDARAAQDAAAASRSGRRAALILRSLNFRVPVETIVVLWGGDRRWASGGRVVDGVHFLDGRELRQWLSSRSTGTVIDRRQAGELLHELGRFKERVNPFEHGRLAGD